MEKEIILKRAIVGGFDRVQVMSCIAALQEKANKAKSDAEELTSLQETLSELEELLSEKDAEVEALTLSVAEAEKKTRVSRASAQLMKESVDYADRYVESAKILAQDITEKTTFKVREAKDKINSILSEITGLSDDILKLYTDLADLKSEYDSFGDVRPVTSSENYLAEEEVPAVEDEAQVCSPSVQQAEPSAELKDEKNAAEIIRKAKEKYRNMI